MERFGEGWCLGQASENLRCKEVGEVKLSGEAGMHGEAEWGGVLRKQKCLKVDRLGELGWVGETYRRGNAEWFGKQRGLERQNDMEK